jgi:hypothetical protein
MAMVCE